MCGCLCPPNASRSSCTQAAPQPAHGAPAGRGTRGRTPRAPLLMAKGGASDTMDKGVFFFAERSTTLERSVRSVTVGQERSRG